MDLFARPVFSIQTSFRPGSYLVLLTWALAVLGQRLEGLCDERDVGLVDIKSEQTQTSGGAPTHDVEELQSLTDQVIVGLVVLAPQEVLDQDKTRPKPRELGSKLNLSKSMQ